MRESEAGQGRGEVQQVGAEEGGAGERARRAAQKLRAGAVVSGIVSATRPLF